MAQGHLLPLIVTRHVAELVGAVMVTHSMVLFRGPRGTGRLPWLATTLTAPSTQRLLNNNILKLGVFKANSFSLVIESFDKSCFILNNIKHMNVVWYRWRTVIVNRFRGGATVANQRMRRHCRGSCLLAVPISALSSNAKRHPLPPTAASFSKCDPEFGFRLSLK